MERGLTGPLIRGIADHGDARRNRRQCQIMAMLARMPDGTIPAIMSTEADAEAFYRFVRNDRITSEAVLEPHCREVCATELEGRAVVLHDSTNLVNRSARSADDVYMVANQQIGWIGHVSLLVDEAGATPVGLASFEEVDRDAYQAAGSKESERWWRGVERTESRRGKQESAIHIMDSEGDNYPLLMQMVEGGFDFVVRCGQERRVRRLDGETGFSDLSREIPGLPTMATLTAEVAARPAARVRTGKRVRRNDHARSERKTELTVRAGRILLQQPKNKGRQRLQELHLAVVQVLEENPPDGEHAIEWRLLTTLPVETAEDAARVVRLYRMRWLIEEFFKSIKVQCRLNDRAFESRKTAACVFALFAPIAAYQLHLRALSRTAPDAQASEFIPETHLTALRYLDPKLPKRPTVKQAIQGFARVGGHLRANGPAGFTVIGRGLVKVLDFAAGWEAALRAHGVR